MISDSFRQLRSVLSQPVSVGLLALLLVSGCGDLIPPRPPIQSPDSAAQGDATAQIPGAGRTPGALQATVGDAIDQQRADYEGDWDQWYVYRFGNQVVGITEVRAEKVLNEDILTKGVSEVEYRRRERLLLRSGRVSFLQRTDVSSVESINGGLLRFRSKTLTGPMIAEVTGSRNQDVLTVSRAVGQTRESTRLQWSDDHSGLFAVEQSLRRKPMASGDTRRLQVLVPALEAVGVVELRCRGDASVAMLDGTYQLLRGIDVVTYRDGQPIDSLVVWTDPQGVVQKSLRPQLRLESVRADRVTAEKLFGEHKGEQVTYAIDGEMGIDAQPSRVTFRIRNVASEDLGTAETDFPQIANQTVERSDEMITVTVTDAPSAEQLSDEGSPALPSDTQPTTEMDFDQPQVKRMSGLIGDLPQQDLVAELTESVTTLISLSQQQELQSASQTVKSQNGGPVDIAIVLAAVLRARGVPARVGVGLTPAASKNASSMSLSGWVLASVDGRWISIDPKTGRTDRADHLCIQVVQGDQTVAAVYSDVFERLSDLEIEIAASQ